MKEVFTSNQIQAFLKKALERSQMPENCETDIQRTGHKAWNRGAKSMYNLALVEMYSIMLGEGEEDDT